MPRSPGKGGVEVGQTVGGRGGGGGIFKEAAFIILSLPRSPKTKKINF